MSIYADSGATLFQELPRTVAFTATPTLVDGVSGSPVTVDGVPITGPNSPMPIQSGALAGYAALARHAGAAIRGPARPDRGRAHQRLRRERPVEPANPALAAGSLHHGGERPALDGDSDRARRRDRGQSDRRPVAGRKPESAARRRDLRPGQSSLCLQYDRRGELYRPPPGARGRDRRGAKLRSVRGPSAPPRASPITPTPPSAGFRARTRRRATPRLIRARSRPRPPRRCRTRPGSISTPK